MARVHACFDTCVIKFATNSACNNYGCANDVPDLLQLLNQNRTDLVCTTVTRAHDFSLEKFLLKSPMSDTMCVMSLRWKSLIIAPSASLNPQDSPCQTYGCRHGTPNNCSRNSMENICAFVTADNICLKPPTGWPRQYEKLLKIT